MEKICQFVVEDINQSTKKEKGYDIVIFGAVGDVLGNINETILKLKDTIKPQGYIIIDDAYSVEDVNASYPSKKEWYQIFQQAGVKLVAEVAIDHQELMQINRSNQMHIVRRANELMILYPENKSIFAEYIKSQQSECEELENEIIGVTWLLQAN
ncbi:methyltransferase domain-containing protein [Desulforamulus ferrireducens]|uniref:Uncharacterized protein n=1 Tax=Desulforamulus ferrireducens TaxID=1833852 RepID=A0A1S6ISH0_9FIRM|nr:methyltransferase domain-containing protein [Desulforamulus ferrireducens]AQS57722.1 hypothetical protein B0537_00405 [Desulforamulus ferrireducens]